MSYHIRYNSEKRRETVEGLPILLLKKFTIVENQDYRGRITFHIAFIKSHNSNLDFKIIPKKYRQHRSLIKAELAIFDMVRLHTTYPNKPQFNFIRGNLQSQNIFTLFREVFKSAWDK